jgi:hypothetical protein
LAADNAVHLREVTVEKYGNTDVRISQGLAANDEFVVSGVHKLFEGQVVRR